MYDMYDMYGQLQKLFDRYARPNVDGIKEVSIDMLKIMDPVPDMKVETPRVHYGIRCRINEVIMHTIDERSIIG